MDSNRTFVDSFLNGNSNLPLPAMSSKRNDLNDFAATKLNISNPSTFDPQNGMQGRGYSPNGNSAEHIEALKKRLVEVITEAYRITAQLQQYGCFMEPLQPSDASPKTNIGEGKIKNEASDLPPSIQNTDPYPAVPKYQQPQSLSPKLTSWEAPPSNVYASNSPIDTASLWGNMEMMKPTLNQNNTAPNVIDVNSADRHINLVKPFPPSDASGPATGHDYVNGTEVSKMTSVIPDPNAGSQSTNTHEYEADDAIELANGANHSPFSASSKEQVVYVEFKRKRIHKYTCHAPSIVPGVYVLVDGDRGTDCGLVTRTVRWLPNGQPDITSMDECGIDEHKIKPGNGYVLRQASNEELDKLHNVLSNAESVALKTCRQRCQEFGIDIKLIDAEYQFDMKKISFFYDSDRSIDFRALVRELYRTFGARIWMENVNPKVKNCMPSESGTCSPTCSSTREPEMMNGSRHTYNLNRRK